MRAVRNSLAAALLLAPLAAPAATIIGHATSTTGNVLYEGLGDLGDGVADGRGAGLYRLGSCAFAGGQTTCTLSGSYVEDAASVSPGATGSFQFRTIWPGSGANPIIARSETAGSDALVLSALGGGHFELELFPSGGGSILGLFPATPSANSIAWSSFLAAGAVCTGSPASCTIGQVGLTNGSTITGPLASFPFRLPLAAPEPATGALLLPLLAWGLARRR